MALNLYGHLPTVFHAHAPLPVSKRITGVRVIWGPSKSGLPGPISLEICGAGGPITLVILGLGGPRTLAIWRPFGDLGSLCTQMKSQVQDSNVLLSQTSSIRFWFCFHMPMCYLFFSPCACGVSACAGFVLYIGR